MAWDNRGDCDECRDCSCRDSGEQCDDCETCDCHHEDAHGNVVHQNKPSGWINETGGVTMNSTIAKMYEKTADAMLVNKYYGHQIANNDVSLVLHTPVADEILASAQALQDAEDARNKK